MGNSGGGAEAEGMQEARRRKRQHLQPLRLDACAGSDAARDGRGAEQVFPGPRRVPVRSVVGSIPGCIPGPGG
jgi:hypothetical protein